MIDPSVPLAYDLRRLAVALVSACLLSTIATAQSAVPDLGENVSNVVQARAIAGATSVPGGPRNVHVIKIWERGDAMTGAYNGREVTGQFPEAGALLTDGVAMHMTVQGPIGEGDPGHVCPPCPSCRWCYIALGVASALIAFLLFRCRRP